MNTDEFTHMKNVRRATGPCSCTGEKSCIHAGCYGGENVTIWYCRHPDAISGGDAHAYKLPNPDNTVCDEYASYGDGSPASFADLAAHFQAKV